MAIYWVYNPKNNHGVYLTASSKGKAKSAGMKILGVDFFTVRATKIKDIGE